MRGVIAGGRCTRWSLVDTLLPVAGTEYEDSDDDGGESTASNCQPDD